jgi:hypothetical protein
LWNENTPDFLEQIAWSLEKAGHPKPGIDEAHSAIAVREQLNLEIQKFVGDIAVTVF